MTQFQFKNRMLLEAVRQVLSKYRPMTVRQVYYRLVAAQFIKNELKSYKNLDKMLTVARRDGFLSYDDFIDRTRIADKESSWNGVLDFIETVKSAYKRSYNDAQSIYIEVWLEKDALAGVFKPITDKYNLFLVVGRGYNSASSLNEAKKRMSRESRPISILYFGDFDPSGEDIYRDIEERLTNDFQIDASFKKVSLTTEDIERYKLPPNPTKIGDTRTAKFVAKHGDVAVELDALRPDILREHVEAAILSKIDKKVWEKELEKEKRDKTQINSLIESLKI